MKLTHAGTYLGASLPWPIGASELVMSGSGALLRLNVVDYGFGVTTKFSLTGGAIGGFQGQSDHVTGRTALTSGGFSGSIVTTTLDAVLAGGAGASHTAYLSFGAEYVDRVELATVSVGAQTYLFAAATDGAGFSVFSAPGGGGLTHLADIADTPGAYADGISAMATVEIGGKSFVYVGSATEDGVTGYEVGAGGTITEVETIGTDQLIPTEDVTDMAVATVAGVTYLIVASAESSSLTVFAIDPDGSLTPVDHVVDDLGTRFQSAQVMDAVTTGGRTYLVVAGADDGLSLMTLLPGGQLLHLQTLSDSAATSMAHVSAIKIVAVGNELQVFVTSALEAGMSMFRIDLSDQGATLTGTGATLSGAASDDILVQLYGDATLSGGAGADILRDGTGSDHLQGGSGADTFVLVEDGVDDVIMDFEWGKDRIDLSHWSYLRNLDDLVITPTALGATIRYGQEFLTVLTSDGRSLTAQDFTTAGLLNITRFPIEGGVPQLVYQGTSQGETLVGTAADELFVGLEGDDLFVGGGGNDQFDGGSGFDIADFTGTGTALSIDWLLASNTGGPNPWFRAMEGVIGCVADDVIRLDDAANLIVGGDGDDLLDGRGGDDTISGGDGADTLLGQDGDDSIDGGEGDDSIRGGRGNDILTGGLGNDTLYGDKGSDWASYDGHAPAAGGHGLTIDLAGNSATDGFGLTDRLFSIENARGTPGTDVIAGSDTGNHLQGLDGDDTLKGGPGNDTLDGGAGNDRLDGGKDADTLRGGHGDDLLLGQTGNDVIDGGDGNDYVRGSRGNDTIDCGAGDDIVYAGRENDVIQGGSGQDTIRGERGRDTIHGGDGDDLIYGGTEDDRIYGGNGNDTVKAGRDRDRIYGGDGDDRIYGEKAGDFIRGNDGNDRLFGGSSRDRLYGDRDDDILYGNSGKDWLEGGAGNDTLTGGSGADTFVFRSLTNGEADLITDFRDEVDVLRLYGVSGSSKSAKFKALDISKVPGGVEIEYDGHVIILDGVSIKDIDKGDFVFV